MIAWLTLVALAAPVRFDRVDLLSESGSWQHDELPRIAGTPRFVAVRYVEQIQPVIALPPEGLQLGLSLRSQTVRYERSVGGPWFLNGGVQLTAGLPNGVLGGVALRHGPVRVGASMGVISAASWARPVWESWRGLPMLGLGVGRDPNRGDTQPWMAWPSD